MNITENGIYLQTKEFFIPHEKKDAYHIRKGTVLIYIIPWEQHAKGRKLLLCEVEAGSVIPAFVYRDHDYKEWRFLFEAKQETEISVLSSKRTSILLRNFANRIHLINFKEEGFDNSLVDFYKKEIVKEEIFIKRGRRKDEVSMKASYAMIKKAFEESYKALHQKKDEKQTAKPLQKQTVKVKDMFLWGFGKIKKKDMLLFLLLGICGIGISMMVPAFCQKIYDEYIPQSVVLPIVRIGIFVITFQIGNVFFLMLKGFWEWRIENDVSKNVQKIMFERLFFLPENFLRKFESADFAQWMMEVGPMAAKLVNSLLVFISSVPFLALYLWGMFHYSMTLSWITFGIMCCYSIFFITIKANTMRYENIEAESKGEAASKLYQYLCGLEKIRIAGAEKQAIHEYLIPFAREQSVLVQKNQLLSVERAISGNMLVICTMIFYLVITKQRAGITIGAYTAFYLAFGFFFQGLVFMLEHVTDLKNLTVLYERFQEFLETPKESIEHGIRPEKLTGEIELKQISFAYREDRPFVLENINLKIKQGEYVALVGPSGCGKSTLLKLLLGFEKPVCGSIFYDDMELSSLDLYTFRQNLGVVLQNGTLISGSILDNIVVTAPNAEIEDVNKVIKLVGLEEDISRMPMGLETVLHEHASSISGGQKQRILIARALIRNPSIVFFDEATSALDNFAQAKISENLERMNITRIVIAHRLSTIRNCDRIIVLSEGRIAEEGSYEVLMKKKGLFYQLASRQFAE